MATRDTATEWVERERLSRRRLDAQEGCPAQAGRNALSPGQGREDRRRSRKRNQQEHQHRPATRRGTKKTGEQQQPKTNPRSALVPQQFPPPGAHRHDRKPLRASRGRSTARPLQYPAAPHDRPSSLRRAAAGQAAWGGGARLDSPRRREPHPVEGGLVGDRPLHRLPQLRLRLCQGQGGRRRRFSDMKTSGMRDWSYPGERGRPLASRLVSPTGLGSVEPRGGRARRQNTDVTLASGWAGKGWMPTGGFSGGLHSTPSCL